MNQNELEIMRNSFKTVKSRSDQLKSSPKVKKLQKKVQEFKKESIENNKELKELAIQTFTSNGFEVLLAKNNQEACNLIYDLIKNNSNKKIAKAKSNTLGEINFKKFISQKGFEVIETDLGDRILQLKENDNKPVHPTGPASHLDVKAIANIINKAKDTNLPPEHHKILEYVRDEVLSEISTSEIGISGANVLAAEEGSAVIVHNEGNVSLVASKKLHIIVAGIDKIVPTIEDAISLVKLETVFATGKFVTSYINVISGPSKTADIEKKLLKDMYGVHRIVLILLDNGRSDALDECLWCIGCGNCLIHCPVYNAVGNEFGFNNYLGGRGVAMSKFIEDEETSYNSGLYMCTLCGLCTLNCPTSIPTNELIENIRKSSTEAGFYPKVHEKISKNVVDNNSPY